MQVQLVNGASHQVDLLTDEHSVLISTLIHEYSVITSHHSVDAGSRLSPQTAVSKLTERFDFHYTRINPSTIASPTTVVIPPPYMKADKSVNLLIF